MLEVFDYIQKRLTFLNIEPDHHKFLGKKLKNTNASLLTQVTNDSPRQKGTKNSEPKFEVNIFNVGLGVLAYGALVYFIERKLLK